MSQDLDTSIKKVPRASACTPVMKMFIYGEIQHHMRDGFNILLPAADVVWIFGGDLKLP